MINYINKKVIKTQMETIVTTERLFYSGEFLKKGILIRSRKIK